ncbi:MAG: CopG family ribbon-helix-helix protein [Euryarchaeota archaeon]|nr:CopG family ribbon-helix-helix protein [Euryarchaeota archaeon]
MTSKRNGTEILSFSLPRELVRKLDATSRAIGYPTRSELIRDGVRLLLKNNERLERLVGISEGVIILIYDHAAEHGVSELRHGFTDIFRSYTHCDFEVKSTRCCEILVFRGAAERVRKAIDGLQSVKKVDEVQVFLA